MDAPFISLGQLSAQPLNAVGKMVDGASLEKTALVHPCWYVLLMGFTWSLYLGQRVDERLSFVGRIRSTTSP